MDHQALREASGEDGQVNKYNDEMNDGALLKAVFVTIIRWAHMEFWECRKAREGDWNCLP